MDMKVYWTLANLWEAEPGGVVGEKKFDHAPSPTRRKHMFLPDKLLLQGLSRCYCQKP